MVNIEDLDSIPEDILNQCRKLCKELENLQQEALNHAGFQARRMSRDGIALNWHPDMTPEKLASEMMYQARKAVSKQSVFQKGRVYCFRCQQASCDHSLPPEPGMVFCGYHNGGEPVWQELYNFLSDAGHEHVAQLFDKPAPLLAGLVGREQLISNQFVGSGRDSMTYRIIGQVVGGYFNLGIERSAMTIQVVENPQRDLHVQVILPQILEAAMIEARGNKHNSFHKCYHALRTLKVTIRDLNTGWKQAAGQAQRQKILDKIFNALRQYANTVARKGRQSIRRTKHAKVRAQQQRPVDRAIDDLRHARFTDFYRDQNRKSIIVVGKRGRAHVFNDEGLHITSFQITSDKIKRREQRQRYIRLSKNEIEKFHDTCKIEKS